MLNYVAIFFVGYLLHGPLQDPNSPLGQTARLAEAARLPRILQGTRLHAGLVIALVVVVVAYILLWHTVWGFQYSRRWSQCRSRTERGHQHRLGDHEFAAAQRRAGGNLAGFAEVAGVQRRMIENISPGYGYTAIVVALLGRTNPPAVLVAAILFAGSASWRKHNGIGGGRPQFDRDDHPVSDRPADNGARHLHASFALAEARKAKPDDRS